MKTLEEKKLLVKMARAFGQPVDQELLDSIEKEERLNEAFFGIKRVEQPKIPILKEEIPPLQPAKAFEPIIAANTVQQTMNVLNTAAPSLAQTLQKSELDGIKQTISNLVQKINTLSWGGGGTGVVRINDTDDFDRTSYGEGKVLRWLNGLFRLDTITGLQDVSFGSFLDTTEQRASNSNTAYAISFNRTEVSKGHYIRNNTEIVSNTTGLHNYQFSIQLSSDSSSQHDAYIWIRKNNVDVPNTATILTFGSNKQFGVAAWNFFVDMDFGDHIQLMWAVDDTRIYIAAPTATSFCPAVPSVILTVNQINA